MPTHDNPIIGINADFLSDERGGFSVLAEGYYSAIIRAGGVPVIVPPIRGHGALSRVLNALDGFVLTGGNSLDLRRDGFMMPPGVRSMHPVREDFDRELVNQLRLLRLPTLGIGVGMQLMNVAYGGSLFLDIKEDRPKALSHREVGVRHSIDVADGSLMDRVFAAWRRDPSNRAIVVNSYHRMSVNNVADGFRVTAKSGDGIIEAIESLTDWWAVGVQFQPERCDASLIDAGLFAALVAEAGSRAAQAA